MDTPTLKFLDIPDDPLSDIRKNRMLDWIEGGQQLTELQNEYIAHYRETVCSTCTHERQIKRKCTALSPYCDTKSCNHMLNANYKKHRNLIIRHRNSHPVWIRARENARCGESTRTDNMMRDIK